jgi:hypothetical protein
MWFCWTPADLVGKLSHRLAAPSRWDGVVVFIFVEAHVAKKNILLSFLALLPPLKLVIMGSLSWSVCPRDFLEEVLVRLIAFWLVFRVC